jgi:hypothetical protein
VLIRTQFDPEVGVRRGVGSVGVDGKSEEWCRRTVKGAGGQEARVVQGKSKFAWSYQGFKISAGC